MAALRLSPASLRLSPAAQTPTAASPVRRISARSSLRVPPLRLRALRRAAPRGRGASGASMMDTAASSYANALADVAVSNGTLGATLADVEKISRTFSDSAVQSFFANPTIAAAEKRDLIAEMARSSELQPHVANFLNILVDMGRIDIVGEIAKEFEAAHNKITGTEVAVVTSVVKLEQQHLAQIAQAVQRLTGAKNVRIKTAIDPALVAGFTVRYGPSGSKLLDMSIKKQLDEIAAQLDFSNIALL